MIRRRNPRSRRSAVAVAVVAVVAVLALGACDTTDDQAPKAEAEPGPSVLAPGKPGEPARTLSPDEVKRATPDSTPNAADFSYAQMMIVHHGQALEMTALVAERASSTQVKRLAARISAAQGPEIEAMEAWLKNHGGAENAHGHDHAAMPGMATDAQLKELAAAKGEAFDDLFLKLMITHHQGAVTMATEAVAEGNNIVIGEMANDVIAQQSVEINRMRAL
ncbi:DUF305 domain-containing protein [Streptomyces sp. NPDC093085]|uniref:DUF305 domain-containing protein n=1 Tax=Streptomyces sp. NPDC093085 TaxID=3155068 RepID=UPI0034341659